MAVALYGIDALKEYYALFPEHISNLLWTKGVKVFVPNNWEGINGVDPIEELNWKSELPDRMKPPQLSRS